MPLFDGTRRFLADSLKDKIKEDRGVRIVGRLKEIGDNIGLFAEHIEFKPVGVKKEGKYTFRNN